MDEIKKTLFKNSTSFSDSCSVEFSIDQDVYKLLHELALDLINEINQINSNISNKIN